jgi:7-cyano-7-deazaguanine synthase
MSKALVILSGGQDSTTCAAVANKDFNEVHAITFNYEQRHLIEIQSAIAVAKALELSSHEIIDLGDRILSSSSPLVSSNKLGKYESIEALPGGVEPTFVPGRNILFLTIAANRAASLGCTDIFIGVCEEDFGGYWDCRQDFIDLMSLAIGQGVYGDSDRFKIHTPLMNLSKADSVKLAVEFLGDDFDRVMGMTHTCYDGVLGGCGSCHACHLRDRGFKESGIVDPLWELRCTSI